jgi:hypothetical protein
MMRGMVPRNVRNSRKLTQHCGAIGLRPHHGLCIRLASLRAAVNEVQGELWGEPPYPQRTMFEVERLFDDDIVETDSIFYSPRNKEANC